MRFDDDASRPSSDAPAPAGGGRSRRRAARPWSNPAPAVERTGLGGALDEDWKGGASTRPPSTPLLSQAPPPDVDLAPIATQLAAVQAQLTALQAAVTVPPPVPDASLVTGSELAAAIEGLGTALGGGMATLLTEHRNLLARDVSTAADRILEEVGTRLRAASTQTIDGVEERIRHLVTRAVGDLTEQVELRLDKLQADVTGLRAVLLEIPDQTTVVERLDQLADSVTSSRGRDGGRMSPAMVASIERSVAGPLEQLEESVNAVASAVRELLDERLPEDLVESITEAVGGEGPGIDADAVAALTKEMTALRRRISLRTGSDELPEVTDGAEAEAEADVLPEVPIAPPSKVTGRRGRRSISG